MKLEWKVILLILCSLILIDAVFATGEIQNLGVFKTQQVVTLSQTSVNATYVNVTRVIFPNSTQSFINQAMTQPVAGNFKYDFSITDSNGQYIVTTCGDPSGVYSCVDYIFVINPLGKTLTEPQARLYSLIMIIAGIIFVICISLGIYLRSGNKRDEMTGYIIAIDNLKYLKMFLLCIAYLVFMLIIYFGYIVSYAYLDLDFLGSLLYALFVIMAVLIVPFFIIGIFVVIANKVRDSKLAYELSRGFRVK